MKPDRRRKQSSGWMDGFGAPPSFEARCSELEDRLRDGTPRPFAGAPRVHLEAEWWAL